MWWDREGRRERMKEYMKREGGREMYGRSSLSCQDVGRKGGNKGVRSVGKWEGVIDFMGSTSTTFSCVLFLPFRLLPLSLPFTSSFNFLPPQPDSAE